MGKRINSAVWVDKYQRWQLKVQKDGQRRTFYSGEPGRNGQRECNAKADAWLDEGIVDENTRISALFALWIDELKLTTSRGNWQPYESLGGKWILPVIGHLKISALNEQHVQDVINNAFKVGKLSAKTLKNTRACMVTFLGYCRRNKTTTLRPEFIKIPRGAKASNKQTLQPDDLKLLFTEDLTKRGIKEWFIYAFRFATVTGLRPGEMAGLKTKDISDGVLCVRRAINKYGEVTPGKNKNAQRTVVLPQIALDLLSEQQRMLKTAGLISAYVFPGENGEHMHEHTYYMHWCRYRDHVGISPGRTPYELRHTFISVNKKIPAEMLKPMVGHSKDMDTFGVYGHALNGESYAAARMIDEAFQKLLK